MWKKENIERVDAVLKIEKLRRARQGHIYTLGKRFLAKLFAQKVALGVIRNYSVTVIVSVHVSETTNFPSDEIYIDLLSIARTELRRIKKKLETRSSHLNCHTEV